MRRAATGHHPTTKITPKVRCAIYTRKSSEEGLDMEFNSLDAQREACAAYILSQKPEGWVAVADRYDDGGISGGTLERPALKRLIADIEFGKVDVVVVYKIDRLSRSLMDFAKLVEVFERRGVTFVSVTQSFNTTTSMGRLTLNILLSFAQFEREVIGERIRDKVAASRRKGMWMGGYVPLGYRVENRKLLVNEEEAASVRLIFERFVKLGSIKLLMRELQAAGIRSRRGYMLDKGALYKLLNNRVYIGEAVHKGEAYPGEHEAIISADLWQRAPRHHGREPAHARQPDPTVGTVPAAGPDLLAEWRRHVAEPHPEGRPALPLLCHAVGPQTRSRNLSGGPDPRRRDRDGGDRAASRLPARTGTDRADMDDRDPARRSHHRGRGSRRLRAARSDVG
jgi:site-specific DNA recombinase